MKFSVATYNIHKGFSHLTRRMVIHELKEQLHGLEPDVLFLQEVQGVNHRHAWRYHDWPQRPQHEFIADTKWHEVAYGRNAVYRHGHHGNALLSLDVEQLEQLGGHSLIYGVVSGSDARATLHVAGQTAVRTGTAMGVSMDATHAHLFAVDDAGATL